MTTITELVFRDNSISTKNGVTIAQDVSRFGQSTKKKAECRAFFICGKCVYMMDTNDFRHSIDEINPRDYDLDDHGIVLLDTSDNKKVTIYHIYDRKLHKYEQITLSDDETFDYTDIRVVDDLFYIKIKDKFHYQIIDFVESGVWTLFAGAKINAIVGKNGKKYTLLANGELYLSTDMMTLGKLVEIGVQSISDRGDSISIEDDQNKYVAASSLSLTKYRHLHKFNAYDDYINELQLLINKYNKDIQKLSKMTNKIDNSLLLCMQSKYGELLRFVNKRDRIPSFNKVHDKYVNSCTQIGENMRECNEIKKDISIFETISYINNFSSHMESLTQKLAATNADLDKHKDIVADYNEIVAKINMFMTKYCD